jgi:uncharacterized Ntn-hydrolase superfamily protein
VTFSIVACDLRTGSWGVAVASRYLAVGANVPAAQSDVGAVATQSWTNVSYKQTALAALREGCSAAKALEIVLAGDDGRAKRQVGIVDAAGEAASWTGPECSAFAAGRTGPGYAIQGNLLAGPQVLDAMTAAWLGSDAPFAQRLLGALNAGDEVGGDARGRQSAALLVARRDADYSIGTDVDVDLRVDDNERPIAELARLLGLRLR